MKRITYNSCPSRLFRGWSQILLDSVWEAQHAFVRTYAKSDIKEAIRYGERLKEFGFPDGLELS